MEALTQFTQFTRIENRIWAMAGGFALSLLAHALWSHYIAYPQAFEKHLKNGKPWVYIPLRWKGLYKSQALWVGRLLLISALAFGLGVVALASIAPMAVALTVAFVLLSALLLRWNALWLSLRYRQQEDTYYHLHDSLKEKLESEGKDFTEAAFRNLAAYQHQNLLRKADEGGHLTQTLRQQAQLSKAHKRVQPSREQVES
jgi:hypothetical protein